MGLPNPKVSIIIPAYNTEDYISEAINSVLEQTFQDFELIVVNDKSTDNTKKEIESFLPNSKIIFVDLERNRGRAGALNEGLKIMNGEFVSFLDSDDIYILDKTEKQVKFMEKNPEVDMVYGTANYAGSREGRTPLMVAPKNLLERMKKSAKEGIEELKRKDYEKKVNPIFLTEEWIAGCSVLIRRRVFDSGIRFDENLRNIEDYDLWYQLVGAGFKIKEMDDSFYLYRQHENQKSKVSEKMKIATDYIFKKFIGGEYFKVRSDKSTLPSKTQHLKSLHAKKIRKDG